MFFGYFALDDCYGLGQGVCAFLIRVGFRRQDESVCTPSPYSYDCPFVEDRCIVRLVCRDGFFSSVERS